MGRLRDEPLQWILEEYDEAPTKGLREAIFWDIVNEIWDSPVQLTYKTRKMSYHLRQDLIGTEMGNMFNKYRCFRYDYAVTRTGSSNTYDILKQIIVNLYIKYFDTQVGTTTEYYNAVCKQLNPYYEYIMQTPINSVNEKDTDFWENKFKANIADYHKQRQISDNRKIKGVCSNFKEFQDLIVFYLAKIIDNYDVGRSSSYSGNASDILTHDTVSYDKLIVKYINVSLQGYMKSLFYDNMRVDRNRLGEVGVCECGRLFMQNSKNNRKYCDTCQAERKKKRSRDAMKKKRSKN